VKTKLDLYKKFAADYATPRQPALVKPGAAQYLSIEGRGEPGGTQFIHRLGCLYNVAFTIKMTNKFAGRDYAVCKLEGLWWGRKPDGISFLNEPRSSWRWALLIRTPDFIGKDDLAQAIEVLRKREKPKEVADVKLRPLDEGQSVQMLHVGPYDQESKSLELMEKFVDAQQLEPHGVHHEIYLSDPRRVAAERLRTILRMPVRRARA
jgi:hypothetical protein